jgi:hypothetical protein
MAVGDDATAAGYPLVPDSGVNGRIHDGYLEINRTRDFVAQLKGLIPTGKASLRSYAGINSGTTPPDNSTGDDGDIYFQILP